jgi:hypothetical protein
MAAIRLLYLSPVRATVYRWKDGDLQEEAHFAHDEEGLAAFGAHLARLRQSDSVFHVLIDVVEEAFQGDVIPFVRGKDRRALLSRRLAQRFRDTTLSMSTSLGYERTQRREERVLLCAFTNIEFLEPWLAALVNAELSVSGVYSPALLSPAMAQALPAKNTFIIVSVQEAGLRQTFIENGKLRFSRLSPMSLEDLEDSERLSIALGTETGRVYQYLRATNVLTSDHPPIEVAVIAPPGQAGHARRYMPELPQLQIKVLDQQDIGARVGLGSHHHRGGAELLFLTLLARKRPALQYAPLPLRRRYRDYQARIAVVLGGGLVGFACVLAAGAAWWQNKELSDTVAGDRSQTAVTQRQYNDVEAKFPRLPTTRDRFRAAMQQHDSLQRIPRGPEHFAVELSAVLDGSPRVELQKLRWHLNTAAAAAASGSQPTPKPGDVRYEVMEIDATLNGVAASDYRGANTVVESFVDELKKIPGVQVVSTRMPFQTGSQESLSAQIGQSQSSESLQFGVVLARRIGS